jgi:hypothetical protein
LQIARDRSFRNFNIQDRINVQDRINREYNTQVDRPMDQEPSTSHPWEIREHLPMGIQPRRDEEVIELDDEEPQPGTSGTQQPGSTAQERGHPESRRQPGTLQRGPGMFSQEKFLAANREAKVYLKQLNF